MISSKKNLREYLYQDIIRSTLRYSKVCYITSNYIMKYFRCIFRCRIVYIFRIL